MSFTLDHVVVAVTDLDRAIADWRNLGFTVTPGGDHTNGVSHNALVVFADGTYFELIAYRAPVPENRWWRRLTESGEGFVDFALLPASIARDADAARARGLDLVGPSPGGRLRPDGVRLDWQVARPATADLPFWCADVTPRALRVPEGDGRLHANGVVGIARVTVAVRDLAASAARWRRLLGDGAVRVAGALVAVDLADTRVELVDARDAGAAAHLAGRGEGVVRVALAGLRAERLDPAASHGAALTIEPAAARAGGAPP
ncbi:VOC family protein [Siculibacillus lacustris]|uniref:VOC family protein n=1 Tax=Siculibacillus lacustris TaxID=1549641 RepID=A0A4Q9VY34_9HYPH|nr:VOC family protein [Siculibacillus lacustris]TBW41300.1 VOC family protein [Siculibacillus lacustris]